MILERESWSTGDRRPLRGTSGGFKAKGCRTSSIRFGKVGRERFRWITGVRCLPLQLKRLLKLSPLGYFATLVAEQEGLLVTIPWTQMAVLGLETL